MEKKFIIVEKPIPNPKADRRSNTDWTAAPEFPAGVYCEVTRKSGYRYVVRITEHPTHRWGSLESTDPRFQSLLAASKPCPPLVLVAVALAEPYGPRDILRRLVESRAVSVKLLYQAAHWLAENGPDNKDYDETTDRWVDASARA